MLPGLAFWPWTWGLRLRDPSFKLSFIWDYKSMTLFLVEVGGYGHRDTVFMLQHINAIIVGLASS